MARDRHPVRVCSSLEGSEEYGGCAEVGEATWGFDWISYEEGVHDDGAIESDIRERAVHGQNSQENHE